MTKTKNTPISRKDCAYLSPLSVATCVAEIKAMAHYELEVRVVRQSKHSAELEVVERYNDDVPLYITYRLMDMSDGTCVSYHLSSLLVRDKKPTLHKSQPTHPQDDTTFKSIIGALIFILIVILILQLPVELFVIYAILIPPISYLKDWIDKIKAESDPTKSDVSPYQSEKVRQLMLKRAEAVKSEVIRTLRSVTKDVRYDELGNAYYLDLAEKQKGGQS